MFSQHPNATSSSASPSPSSQKNVWSRGELTISYLFLFLLFLCFFSFFLFYFLLFSFFSFGYVIISSLFYFGLFFLFVCFGVLISLFNAFSLFTPKQRWTQMQHSKIATLALPSPPPSEIERCLLICDFVIIILLQLYLEINK